MMRQKNSSICGFHLYLWLSSFRCPIITTKSTEAF